ncbi:MULTISPECIES: hypothetical protein [Chelativorans]|jgi:hypothetical protein|uniref:hypothetical protein n=1 Tax=Chelativorans TaxID=449972 RepID=UPI00031518E6|nr:MULTISPECIES: hypothetical protein [Chelativorans]
MAETAQRLDEPSVFEKQPGRTEYEARCIIRELIELYGPKDAPWQLSRFLEDELRRVNR